MAEAIPRATGLLAVVGRLALRVAGWKVAGTLPSVPKYVIIVAPHTSNWDFFVGLATKWSLGLDAAFLAKHTLFRGLLGWILRLLRGIPVDRAHPEGTVEAVVARANAERSFVLAVTPEGTRRRSRGWKTGFHRIALATGMPIVPVSFDWSTRTVGFGAPFHPTPDVAADVLALRMLFTGQMARRPELFSDVRDEESAS